MKFEKIINALRFYSFILGDRKIVLNMIQGKHDSDYECLS